MPELNVPSGNADGLETGAMETSRPAIPGHKLLRCIGRGSYGEVWLAQSAEGAFRAVKIVFRKTFERERPFEREYAGIQKFEPVSRSSPSQVGILQVGRDDAAGFFYYVMELADDQRRGREIDPATYKPKTLHSEVAAKGRLPYDRALDISLSLAKALQHLHAHDLIHRDIKPSNIIFVNGVPKLADIGLVTDVGASISYVGTEGFLPPEGPVSKQADIYSLGKVLYEMSTGNDRMEFPELPTFLGESEEKQGLLELNLVFLKACQNEPQRRYRTAQEMYADLTILRSGKSLKQARAAQRRLQKVTRLSLAAACLALLVGVGLYALDQYRIRGLRKQVNQKDGMERVAREATLKKSRQLIDSYLRSGEELGGIDGLPWYARALTTEFDPPQTEDHRKLLAGKLQALPRLVGFFVHGAALHSAQFSPDATRIVTAGKDKAVKVWDVATGTLASKPLTHPDAVFYAELSADDERAFTVCENGSAWLWRVGSEVFARELEHGAGVSAGQFSPGGRYVLTRAADNYVCVWDGISARQRFKFDCGETPIDAQYTPSGEYVCVATATALIAWEMDRGQRVAHSKNQLAGLSGIAISPDSRRLVAHGGPTARFWNLTSGEWSAFSMEEPSAIALAQFLPDGRHLITATTDGAFRLRNAGDGRVVADAWGLPGALHEFEVSADGSTVGVRMDDRASLVDVRAGRTVATFAQAAGHTLSFSSDARLFLCAGPSGIVRLVEIPGAPSDYTHLSSDNLLALARLISGREVSSNDTAIAVAPERLASDWNSVKALAAIQPANVPAWHAARAERFEKDKAWFALEFHAGALKSLNAADARAAAWLDKAKRELARADTSPSQPEAIPGRPANAGPDLIDLSGFYNASLTRTWLPIKDVGRGNDLAQLPSGVQKFAGVVFDVRGLIQLSGSELENLGGQFPKQVLGIPINREATNVHFLHGAAWDALYGTVIGKYRINYANGDAREMKIVFGRDVRDWWFAPTQPQLTMGAALAWQGANPASRQLGMAIRIYKVTWGNPLPDVEIKSIDFESAMEKPAPFLLAITVGGTAR